MKKFSNEAVTKGHPDKVADQISDALLDAYLKQNPEAKVAIETIVTQKKVIILGEIKTQKELSSYKIDNIIRETVYQIGYNRKEENFSYDDLTITNLIHEQSEEINTAVVKKKGAGDQGLMFGFATDETPLFLPLNFFLARNLAQKLTELREKKILPFLRPDGKTQITFVYDENNCPLYIDSLVVSCQHDKNLDPSVFRQIIMEKIIMSVIPAFWLRPQTKFYINPSQSFTQGGPAVDTGLTGRKIIQDAYGGEVRHGGGCFSGKDATKVDRSGAYIARYLAKNLVAAGICSKCEIQISYAIGLEKPVGLFVNTFNTSKISENTIIDFIQNKFDLSPQGIIKKLNLTQPLFEITAREGHFGRQDNLFTWEQIDQDLFVKLLA